MQQRQQKNQKYPPFFFCFTIITNASNHIQTALLLFNGDIVQNRNWHMWLLILQRREPQPPSSCQLTLANLICLSLLDVYIDTIGPCISFKPCSYPEQLNRFNLTHRNRQHWDLKADTEAMEGLQVMELFNLPSKKGKLNQ